MSKDYLQFNLAEVRAFSKDESCARVLYAEIERLRTELTRLRAEVEKWQTVAATMSTEREHNANEAGRLRAELAVAENWVSHHSKHADDLIAENVKLRADLERFTKQIKDDHRSYGCELRDPNGTIWEQAAKDHARAEKAEAECVEQARLLGMSGEREAALLSALKLMVSKFDAFIDSEYCGTDLLAEQLAQADFARKVIMGEARK